MQKPCITDINNGWLTVSAVSPFCVFRTFDCGQCFRFDSAPDPTYTAEVEGIAKGRYVRFAQKSPDELYVKATEEEFNTLWADFLALDRDYESINKKILLSLNDKEGASHMEKAFRASEGIRILRQDSWEALCSFIISQNNNIPRIKGIIRAMSEKYGEKIEGGYAFPTPKTLCDAGESEIFKLKTGFRAKYIVDAARRVCSGEIDLDRIKKADYADAEKELLTICGVGPKVAACTLLFGFEKTCAFPIDVWIKRVMEKRFPNGLDYSLFGEYAGIAQQYLFYYERYIGDANGN